MLDEYLEGIGYTDIQIKQIHKIYPKPIYSESTLLYNFKNLYNYLRRNGMDNKDFIFITLTCPNYLMESLEKLKEKMEELNSFGFNKISAFQILKQYPYILETSSQKIKNKLDRLGELGFSKQAILLFVTDYPAVFRIEANVIKKIFQYFLEFGFSRKDVIYILMTTPQILECTINQIQSKIDFYHELGFQDFDIIKIISTIPNLLVETLDLDDLAFSSFYHIGYTKEDLVHLICKVPLMIDKDYLTTVSDKFECFFSLGFAKEEILFITSNNPYVFFYSPEDILEKVDKLKVLGFSAKQVQSMILSFPILLGYHIHTLQERIQFYREIGMEKYLLENGKILLFPLKFIQKRYHYMMEKKLLFPKNQADLFLSPLEFQKKYSVSADFLLKGEM